jgi:hypothetical protein
VPYGSSMNPAQKLIDNANCISLSLKGLFMERELQSIFLKNFDLVGDEKINAQLKLKNLNWQLEKIAQNLGVES